MQAVYRSTGLCNYHQASANPREKIYVALGIFFFPAISTRKSDHVATTFEAWKMIAGPDLLHKDAKKCPLQKTGW